MKALTACVVFVLAAIGLLRELHIEMNADCAWLLHAAQRLAGGERLYDTLLETNPPLIVWLNLVPVYMAKWLHIAPQTAFVWAVTLLNLGVLALLYRLMSERTDALKYILIAYFAYGFFILSATMYGERELLFVTLVLPYLLHSLGVEKQRLSVAVLAAIGFALKPFFLLLWVANEIAIAYGKRSVYSLFSPGNWIIGLAQVGYAALVYFCMPEYTANILPVLAETYFAFSVSLPKILTIIAYIGAFTGLLVWLAQPRGDVERFIRRAGLWAIACALLMVVQRKDWLNHLYPLVFMVGLVVTLIATDMVLHMHKLKLDIGHRRFAGLCIAVAALLISLFIEAKLLHRDLTKPSAINAALHEQIERHAFGKAVYPLSFNLMAGFPVINSSNGLYFGSFQQLWPLPGLLIRKDEKTPALAHARQFFYDRLVKDFTDFPPQLVWVDENVGLENIAGYAITPQDRDIIAVLAHDKRFAALWKNYRKIGYVEGEQDKTDPTQKPERFTLYLRK